MHKNTFGFFVCNYQHAAYNILVRGKLLPVNLLIIKDLEAALKLTQLVKSTHPHC